jgi:hypothetical protein
LEICEEVCREEEVDADRDEIDEEMSWDDDSVSLVGLRVVVTDAFEAMTALSSSCRGQLRKVVNGAKRKLRNVISSRYPCCC